MTKLEETLRRLRAGSAVLVLLAAGVFTASHFVAIDVSRSLLIAAGAAFLTIFLLLVLATWWVARRLRQRRTAASAFFEHDAMAVLCADADGTIFAQNAAASEMLGDRTGGTIAQAFDSMLANPDEMVARLAARVATDAAASEETSTRKGEVRISAHQVPGSVLWRVESLSERPARQSDSPGLPMLSFGQSGTILFMNDALRAAAGQRTRRLHELFETVPLENGGLNRLRTADGPEAVRVILSGSVGGRQDAFVIPAGEAVDERVALDDLPVALLRLDREGEVIFASRLARELLPALDAATERRFAALVEGLGRSVREWVGEAASGRGLYRAEVVRVSGAEVETYLQVTLGRPLDDPDGGLLAVLNDATELKTLEAQFVQSQKMQAIGQLAGGVAHDFNNLLTAISGHCDLLLLRHEENDEDFADLTQITHNANRAAALVGQLLAFSRKQTLEMQPIDLREALGDLAHLLNRLVGERVTLRLQHDPALIPIRGDRRQLEQVLMNLVVNARDAMPEGGEVLIETKCRYLDTALARDRVTVPPGQYVVVEVSDQGCGISADNLSRIFEPFFTTKRPGEGTGLGLSMAYGIVKQSGGYIFADSTIGGGTRFSLYFPAMAPEEDASSTEPVRIPSSVAAMHAAIPGRRDMAAPEGRHPTQDDAAAAGVGRDLDVEGERDADAEDRASDGDAAGTTADGEDVKTGLDVRIERVMAAVASGRTNDGAERTLNAGAPPEMPAEEVARPGEPAEVRDPPDASLPPPAPVAAAGEAPSAQERKQVVLLVEDEAPVRAFASRALRLRGYEVMEAENAESALEQLADETVWVDLFVTDVMMPGLDGPTWVREALKTRPDVRTVFISGYTQDALSETSQPVPNAVFLPKPFSLSDLTRTVEKALT